MTASSQISTKLEMEFEIVDWKFSGLLKPSVFKSSVATIDQEVVLAKLGQLSHKDGQTLEKMLTLMC